MVEQRTSIRESPHSLSLLIETQYTHISKSRKQQSHFLGVAVRNQRGVRRGRRFNAGCWRGEGSGGGEETGGTAFSNACRTFGIILGEQSPVKFNNIPYHLSSHVSWR